MKTDLIINCGDALKVCRNCGCLVNGRLPKCPACGHKDFSRDRDVVTQIIETMKDPRDRNQKSFGGKSGKS